MGSLRDLQRTGKHLKLPLKIFADVYSDETLEIKDVIDDHLLKDLLFLCRSESCWCMTEFSRDSSSPTKGRIDLLIRDQHNKISRVMSVHTRAKTYLLGKKMEQFFVYLKEFGFDLNASMYGVPKAIHVYRKGSRKKARHRAALQQYLARI